MPKIEKEQKIETSELVTISAADWKAKAADLFGDDPKQWRFKCPMCGETQTWQDFIDNDIKEPETVFYYSCIGRWVEGRGCDWTLGGLFRIHKVEVIDDKGNSVPVMEFAD